MLLVRATTVTMPASPCPPHHARFTMPLSRRPVRSPHVSTPHAAPPHATTPHAPTSNATTSLPLRPYQTPIAPPRASCPQLSHPEAVQLPSLIRRAASHRLPAAFATSAAKSPSFLSMPSPNA